MKAEIESTRTHRITIEVTDEERREIVRAIDLLQSVLPSPDDGLSMLRRVVAANNQPLYRHEEEAQVSELTPLASLFVKDEE